MSERNARTRHFVVALSVAAATHAAVLAHLSKGVGGTPGAGGALASAAAAPSAVAADAALSAKIASWRASPVLAAAARLQPPRIETSPSPDTPDTSEVGLERIESRAPPHLKSPSTNILAEIDRKPHAPSPPPRERRPQRADPSSPTPPPEPRPLDRTEVVASAARPGRSQRDGTAPGAKAGGAIEAANDGDGGDRARLADARAAYGRLLRRVILENQRYPRRARLKGWEGVARVRFELAPNGAVMSASLVQTTGRETLDRAAVDLIRNEIRRFPPPPEELLGGALQFSVEIAYALR